MAEAKEKKSMYLIHCIVMVAIAFVFRVLPCPGTVTPYGMAVLGVFVSLIYGWTFIDLLIPSLFGAVALAMTGYGSVQDVFLAMFANSTVLMMMFGVLAFAAVEQTGAGDWMIAKLLGSSLAKKSPVWVVEIFFVIFILGNIFGLVWFLYFALLPLMYKMLLKCGYEKGDKFNALFLCGCLMFGQLGMCIFPFLSWSLMTCGTMMALTQVVISNNAFMAMMLIMIAIGMVTYPFFMKLMGCDFSKIAEVDVEATFGGAVQSEGGKLNQAQLLSLVSVVAFVVILVAASFLSASVPALAWVNTTLGVLGLMILLWLFVVAMKVDGKPILDMRKAAGSFSWDMLILIAVALLISSALTATETGISAWISGILAPIFAGTHPLVFLIAIGAITIILTNFSNNIAICFIMINIVGAMYNNGFPVNITAAALVISVTSVFVAYLTPAASMPGALMHASEVNTPATLYKMVSAMMVYGLLLLCIVIVPYVLLFG